MPVKLRASKFRKHRITPDALAAFAAGDVLGLHRALALKPWQVSPLEVEDGEAPHWPQSSAGTLSWPLAVALRRELIAAQAGDPR